jgi:hypothetical protein
MSIEIISTPDRWVFNMRDHIVTKITPGKLFTFNLAPPGRVTVGNDALLSNGPLLRSMINGEPSEKYSVATLKEYDQNTLGQLIEKRLLATVGFKSGSMRIAFENGWQLNTLARRPFVPALIESNSSTLWQRARSGEGLVGLTNQG